MMAGHHAGQLRDDTRLSTRIVAARCVGCGVGNDRRARVVMTADDQQAIGVFAGQPRDHIECRRGWAARMNEGVEPDLKPGNGAVQLEEEVAGCGHAVAGFGLVRAGLPRPEVLQRGCRAQDAIGIHGPDDLADFGIFGEARVRLGANACEGKSDQERQDAVRQHSFHLESPSRIG